MGEVEEVQEKMKADMEAMKEQMAMMMEAMMIMKKIMEANAVAVAATNTVAKVNPMPQSGLNQMNHPTSAIVGKDLGSMGGPHDVQIQNEHAFPPCGLPLNYTPPNGAYTPNKNVNNSTPIPIESQQPQADHAHPTSSLGSDMPLKGKQLLVYPLKTLRKALSITPNYTSCIPQQVKTLMLWQKWESGETWQLKWHLNDEKTMTMIVDTLPVFYYGKWWATHLQSFADLVFANERIDVGLKRGKFIGANKEGEDEGEARAVIVIPIQPSFPPTQQCHYSANNQPSPYSPPSYPQRPSLKHPQSLSSALPMTNITFSTNQEHQPRNEFCSEKAYRIHPNSSVLC
ncbi:hypothetical protein HKD37_01G000707 [Glycine soja]